MRLTRLFLDLFSSPSRALSEVAERRSVLPPVLVATAASLLLAFALVPRLDFEGAALDRLEAGPGAAEVTPHQREEQMISARKLGTISGYTGAALGTAFTALGVALALWLAFRVVGSRPAFLPTLAVTAWALVPKALEALLLLPAALRTPTLPPDAAGRLAPWSGAFFAGPGLRAPLASLLGSLNLFTLWSAVLLALGMALVSQVSRRRAGAVVGALWSFAVAAGMAAANSAASPPPGA
jgi:hypothetical protein